MNTSGWGETWVPVTNEVWAQAQRGERITVRYLPEAPSANQPAGRVGYPIGDSAFAWGLFVLVDLAWLAESTLMVVNYVRCQVAAERREDLQIRFWRTARRPTAIEQYAGRIRGYGRFSNPSDW
jgi:hypothetical protein